MWRLLSRQGHAAPEVVAFLIPHAGAGPSSMYDLVRALPDRWICYGLLLPGRETRLMEQATWTFEDVAPEAANAAAAIAQDVRAGQDGPPVLVVGQCSGAWIAHAILAHPPLHRPNVGLVVISQSPWHIPRNLPDVAQMTSDELWVSLVANGDVPDVVAESRDMRRALEPALRADVLAVSVLPSTGPTIPVPILAIGGERDPLASDLQLSGWRRYTSQHFTEEWVNSGHLPARDNPGAVALLLAAAVAVPPGM